VLKTRPFDAAEYLETEDDILCFLEVAMDDNDPEHIVQALDIVTRSQGARQMFHESGVNLPMLHNALSENGNPTLETLTSVLSALGLQLTVQKRAA
jgi:probable addiction module antidote protein